MPSPTRSSHRAASPSAPSSSRHHRSRHSHSHRHRPRESSRSRSPHRSDRHRSDRHHRCGEDKDRGHLERRHRDAPSKPIVLPYQARELSGRDLKVYEPMFGMYLDIQKGKYIEDLSEDEVRGRWKSFTQKWNRGELAEGWYDPVTLDKARRSAEEEPAAGPRGGRESPDYTRGQRATGKAPRDPPVGNDDEDDDDEYGPSLPQAGSGRGGPQVGPTIPTMQDLELKRESAMEDAIAARGESRDQYHAEIRSHKSEMRYLQDEIAPRAEAGTRERQLEKRREVALSNRAFADARGGSPEAARDEDLMGGGDEFSTLKREKEKDQRKKNEREIRREEILRARTAEREERAQAYRQKEQETMSFLQALAKQRFG
ncbi:peroxisomal membrane anchor protein conserved region-domain-containing protein [Penicillium digitatum]|uniref:RNA helicase HEL117 n=3 Tax=Penicillium digitatum TaxID=36651 RepID=K9FCM2_PEND2|nr:hypothetical protein PDIP_28830 [Penicillium digitatum Pd1]EKV05847.1 hypothetical protein PDIG_80440 [Penicillium digitatum PHI26]EKV17974.1 hypothetical protein PDIP_28830 [Penicillium digitatum Pd1]KAG0155075.1 hypothetical protein PDIDSM_648 [Penicillium digitatum]QQK47018.1 peroxisomal membrane anchor protein conserved region-domain-containing protein [Penicillium digitatum]